jgi:hypothetical protein
MTRHKKFFKTVRRNPGHIARRRAAKLHQSQMIRVKPLPVVSVVCEVSDIAYRALIRSLRVGIYSLTASMVLS